MPYKEKINTLAANFPGLLESERLDLLNSQLFSLEKRGYTNLVNNFLSNKNLYTIRPFLFKIFICRWLLSQKNTRDIVYEPEDLETPPEFVFNIDEKTFQIEAKVITQLNNETIKKKIVSQINRRISSKTSNVIEIWLSENIEPKDINKIVDWIAVESVSLNVGIKRFLIMEDETLAWVKTIFESQSGGSVGIEHILGTDDGLASQIDTISIRDKLLSKIKKSNKKFKLRCGEDIYNFIFITCDSSIFISKETLQESLYGNEAIISYHDENGEIKYKEVLKITEYGVKKPIQI